MKKIILFLFVSILLQEVNAYDKLSLIERFTNASCGPCATLNVWYNPLTQGWVNSDYISHIVYNTWWPGPNDPMYLLNQADNTTRTNYYGCNYVPWFDVNGTHINEAQGALTTAVSNGNAQFAPFKIVLTQNALGETLIEVGVKIIRDPSDVTTFTNTKLRVALTEKTVSYASPPGSNGEKDFFSICRKMLPDAGGTTFTIPAPGDSVELTLEYIPTSAFLAAVNLDSIRVVAFIQNDNSKLIYQSAMLEFVPQYVGTIVSSSPDEIIANNSSAQFAAYLRNQGIMDDTYDVTATFDGPAGWTGDFSTVNGTFQFGEVDDVQVTVGDSTLISVTVNPNYFNGSGTVTVEFISQNNPGVVGSVTFSTVTNTGVHLLVVDATEGGSASLVSDALDVFYTGRYGVVSRNALQAPGIDLSYFTMISWSAGNSLPAFYPEEVNNLQTYLDLGGNLLINGQNIGADIFEPGGQSQFAQSFFNNYLHSNYVNTFGGSNVFTAVGGDPITGDIPAFSLNSIYTKSPDEISPYDASATQILYFLTGPSVNSIRSDNGNHKVIYFGIGFEQINDANNWGRVDTLVARSVSWLTEGIILSDPNEELVAQSYQLEQNYPNPFNPATTISYSIPKESRVSLKIYDVMGREVAELVTGRQAAGSYNVEFDASSLASGTYFYKLTAEDFISVKKMVLLK
jgi:Secretion system C-terminal sorting domain